MRSCSIEALRPPAPRALDGMTVLVVDDHPDIRDLLTEMLEVEGAMVLTARSMTTAIALLGVTPIDVVVTDFSMPGGNGVELLRAMRADPRCAQIHAVLISAAHDQRSLVRDAHIVGATFLPKPFLNEDLVRAVAQTELRSTG